jgi:carboxylesterase
MHITYDIPDFNAKHYQDRSQIRKCARPWAMLHDDKASHAVLLCHGYTGYPGELIRPGIDIFEKGMDVYCPRYPGHGTSGDDFLASKAEDWIGTVYDACAYLVQQYDQVSLVGHSMGGAIATLIADAFDVETLALIAPALVVPTLPVTKVRILRHFIKRRKVAWQRDSAYTFLYEGDSDDDAYLGSQYWSYQFPKKIWDLELVRRQAVACIDHLKANTLAISGGEDDLVPKEASLLVTGKKRGKNHHLHIEKATHLMPYDKDKQAQDQAMHAIAEWLSKDFNLF